MSTLVLGSGAGALAVAAEYARAGRRPILADLPEFARNLEHVRDVGGVTINSTWHGTHIEPVSVADDFAAAVRNAELITVVVPAFGHEPFMHVLAPILHSGQSLLFFGEGSGSLVAAKALTAARKRDVRIGETNTLPYLARLVASGEVSAERKRGGVFLAGLPSTSTDELLSLVSDVWPYVSAAESVWETVLLNYNAIDHVATVLANVGTLENRSGGMLLWGEGASPSVVRAIDAVDHELFALRQRLGLADRRRYKDCLIEQGLAPADADPGLFEVLRKSRLMGVSVPTGPSSLQTRFITEDVPYALVLASSIGDEIGVDTPVIDGLIAVASAMLGRAFREEGRTLAKLGLAGIGLEGLRQFAHTGELSHA